MLLVKIFKSDEYTLIVTDNGVGTYNHLYTSTTSLNTWASKSILGGLPRSVETRIVCGCISFYKIELLMNKI